MRFLALPTVVSESIFLNVIMCWVVHQSRRFISHPSFVNIGHYIIDFVVTQPHHVLYQGVKHIIACKSSGAYIRFLQIIYLASFSKEGSQVLSPFGGYLVRMNKKQFLPLHGTIIQMNLKNPDPDRPKLVVRGFRI